MIVRRGHCLRCTVHPCNGHSKQTPANEMRPGTPNPGCCGLLGVLNAQRPLPSNRLLFIGIKSIKCALQMLSPETQRKEFA
jgi:hypothetical protein